MQLNLLIPIILLVTGVLGLIVTKAFKNPNKIPHATEIAIALIILGVIAYILMNP
jgi:hypothetical protein